MLQRLPNVPTSKIRRAERISNFTRSFSLLDALELVERANKYSKMYCSMADPSYERCANRAHYARMLFDNIDQRDRGKMMTAEAIEGYKRNVASLVLNTIADLPTWEQVSTRAASRNGVLGDVTGHFALKKYTRLERTLKSLAEGFTLQPTTGKGTRTV